MAETAVRKQVARKLAETDSTLLTLEKLDILIEQIEKGVVEQWLAIRKEVGQQIDPETAEVEWWYAQNLDPYGVNPNLPEEECRQVGREYFARSPGSEVWVCFRDLPERVRDALWKKHGSRLAFPAGLPSLGGPRDEQT